MSDATSLCGLPIESPPLDFPRPMPDGDTADNYFLSLCPNALGVPSKLVFRPVHLIAGPSSLGGNIALPGREVTPLWELGNPVSALEFDPNGMRAGLMAYVPPGVYMIFGVLVVACPGSTEVDVIVKQGHTLSGDLLRPGIISESAEQVGYGGGTTSASDYRPHQIFFAAPNVQFSGVAGTANEISVWAYVKNDLGGAALGVIASDGAGGGGGPSHMVSWLVAMRVRG